MFLSVVIPVFNEEQNIRRVVEEHIELLKSLTHAISGWEIVCLDDASTDSSLEILLQLSESNKEVKVIKHLTNKGIYQSFSDLFHEARGTHIYATGGDGQWPADNLRKMFYACLERKSDLVIGVRTNRRKVYSIKRRLISYIFNLLPELLFGVQTLDANGIKLGIRDIFIKDLISNSFFSEIERIIKSKREGRRIDFVPIEFQPRKAGKSSGTKWSYIIATVRDCVKFFIMDKKEKCQ